MISDARPRKRGYTRKGIRAFFTYTGSHSKTIIHGLLTTDGRGMFRQYDEFTKDTFADFLKQALYKFKKICLIMDRASQHRATKIRELVEKTDGLEIIFLPTATPDLSAIETYWRDLKRAVLDVSYIYVNPPPDLSSFCNQLVTLGMFFAFLSITCKQNPARPAENAAFCPAA